MNVPDWAELLPDWAEQPLLFGAIAAALTAVQLWVRFEKRRLGSSGKTIGFTVLICLLAGAASFLLVWAGSPALGVAALAVSYPASAPRPGADAHKDDPQGASKQVINAIWLVMGSLTERLDRELSVSRADGVAALKADLSNAHYTLAPYEEINSALSQYVEGRTDEKLKASHRSQLRAAYRSAQSNGGEVTPLLNLAYDWKLDAKVRSAFLS